VFLHDWQGDSDGCCRGLAEDGNGEVEILMVDNELLSLQAGSSDEQLAPIFLLCFSRCLSLRLSALFDSASTDPIEDPLAFSHCIQSSQQHVGEPLLL
jgi:hypothetical protein